MSFHRIKPCHNPEHRIFGKRDDGKFVGIYPLIDRDDFFRHELEFLNKGIPDVVGGRDHALGMLIEEPAAGSATDRARIRARAHDRYFLAESGRNSQAMCAARMRVDQINLVLTDKAPKCR